MSEHEQGRQVVNTQRTVSVNPVEEIRITVTPKSGGRRYKVRVESCAPVSIVIDTCERELDNGGVAN